MSVEKLLGFDPDFEQVIADSWPEWVRHDSRLAAVDDPRRLRAWVKEVDEEVSDDVVHALATLASADGANDRVAALVVAWLMVPPAAYIARNLSSLSAEIDQLVAGELWILVRTFPLRRRKVVKNLMRDLKSRVFVLCEVRSTLQRTDPTWFATVFSIEAAARHGILQHRAPSALEELVDVLNWACDEQVIDAIDRTLVLLLVEAAQHLDVRIGSGLGLLSNEATARVAAHLGLCERTVRRRARRTIAAVTAAAPGYTRVA